MAVSLEKVRELTGNDEGMVSLVKKASNAAGVSLAKHGFRSGLTAEVCMVMDFSGSMENRYLNGEVQDAMERVLALATQFDNDGAVPVILFHNDAWVAGEVDLTNYKGWIDQAIRGQRMGGTIYSSAIDQVLNYYGMSGGRRRRGLFGRSGNGSSESTQRQYPIYVAFFTDGEPQDPDQSERAIRDAADKPVFWQFVGLGRHFEFLEELDDMKGRVVDNADFFSANRLAQMSDADLFDKLCDEFPGWVREVKKKGWIA